MPTYSYACTVCGHRFDVQQSFTDDALTQCPECTGRLRKLYTGVGVVFKGSGFYRTDARKDGERDRKAAPGREAGSSDGGSSGTSESAGAGASGGTSSGGSGAGSSGGASSGGSSSAGSSGASSSGGTPSSKGGGGAPAPATSGAKPDRS